MARLLRLRRQALHGNKRSERAFRREFAKQTAIANRMLDRLESAGFTEQAYKSAQNFTRIAYESNRFDTELTDMKAMYRQLVAINHFRSLETSTIGGNIAVQKRRIKRFREFTHSVDDDGNYLYSRELRTMTNAQILDFFSFLHEKPIDTALNSAERYNSGNMLDNFAMFLGDENADKDTLYKALQRYEASRNGEYENDPKQKLHFDELVKYLRGQISITFNGDTMVLGDKKK